MKTRVSLKSFVSYCRSPITFADTTFVFDLLGISLPPIPFPFEPLFLWPYLEIGTRPALLTGVIYLLSTVD